MINRPKSTIRNPQTQSLFKNMASGAYYVIQDLEMGLKSNQNPHPIDINAFNSHGEQLIDLAITHDNPKIVSLILSYGFDLNKINYPHNKRDYYPLDLAVWHRDERFIMDMSVVDCLLDAGANPDNISNTENGNTALHHAVLAGKNKTVASLLVKNDKRTGANPNLSNKAGNTPLHIAARKGNLGILEQLLNAGADLSIRNHNNETAFSLAIANDKQEIVNAILINSPSPPLYPRCL
ncbi:MAG: ankyrin repeat domain-containing protein [Gammaproteobacteria bacterium]|nr:MAG: ankyrin repeat domain-containing protein [Gammaproteobacteria bacterium]